jgi:dihydrofolate reductase
MRTLIAAEFMSVDGVIDSPDKWHFPYVTDEMMDEQASLMSLTDTLLLGRHTYEGFAAAWPGRTGPLANFMNRTPKVVVSTTLHKLEWQHSTLIREDVSQALGRLKEQPGKNIFTPGSAALVRSLIHNNLLDELVLIIDPIVVGAGKRLFDGHSHQIPLKLVKTKTFASGAISATYEPVRG